MIQTDLSRLKTLTVLAPVVYVLMAEFLRDAFLVNNLSRFQVAIIVTLTTLAAAYVFSELVFSLILGMQRALNRERRRIEGIFLHTSDAVLLLDKTGRVVAMNPAGHALTGHSGESVQSGEVRFDNIFFDRQMRKDSLWWRQLWERGGLPYFEATVVDGEGGVQVTGSATIIPNPEGGKQMALIMRDIQEKAILEAEVERRRLQALGLYDIGLDLASLGDLEESLKTMLRKVKNILRADLVGWAFLNEQQGELDWRVFEGLSEEPLPVSALKCNCIETLVRRALESDGPIAEKMQCATFAVVPVLLRGRAVGVLVVGFRLGECCVDADLLFLSSVTTQAAVALENHELYRRSQGQAILEERERLAKEMHDGFGQTLTYLSAMVATMEQLLRKDRTDEALAKLAETREMLTEAHQEVRTAIFNLREHPSNEDFVAQVGDLLYHWGRQSGIETKLHACVDEKVKLSFETEVQITRVIQEALTNVLKHAKATRIDVNVAKNNGVLDIGVIDNGCGFELAHDAAGDPDVGHYGLHIMRERSQAVGGELAISSVPGKGTEVHLTVPLGRWKSAKEEEHGAYSGSAGG